MRWKAYLLVFEMSEYLGKNPHVQVVCKARLGMPFGRSPLRNFRNPDNSLFRCLHTTQFPIYLGKAP